MRALALLVWLVPAIAAAEPALKPLVVWKDRVIAPPEGGPVELNVSRKLYLNDCQPNGCTVFPGADNSLTNRSSIPSAQALLSAYKHGAAHWASLVQCVRDTFAPFDVEIVTTDPGPSVSHFEVMIGGTSHQLDPELDAGGVAPFVSCGAQRNNAISFVFAESTGDLEFLCGAVAQEACHIWGLDHELNARDPMTYLDLGSSKRFQNDDADCGESLSQPRTCRCGGTTQNSFRYMSNTFGLATNLAPAAVAITTPADGAWVKPGFPITGTLDSALGQLSASIAIDGAEVAAVGTDPIAYNASTSLAPGERVITVSATDNGDRTATATVTVHAMASCAVGGSCAGDFRCLGGTCYPDADVEGGLGATCASNNDCISGSCGSDGVDSVCTGPCDTGAACPSGFACLTESNVCWPTDSGGCSTNGPSGAGGFLMAAIGALAFALRRRR